MSPDMRFPPAAPFASKQDSYHGEHKEPRSFTEKGAWIGFGASGPHDVGQQLHAFDALRAERHVLFSPWMSVVLLVLRDNTSLVFAVPELTWGATPMAPAK
jgi:hypothetical protein